MESREQTSRRKRERKKTIYNLTTLQVFYILGFLIHIILYNYIYVKINIETSLILLIRSI
jgi:hypothetical protein